MPGYPVAAGSARPAAGINRAWKGMKMSQIELTADERTLFTRVAFHMAKGLSMDDAIQAVRDDDFRIACAFGVFRPALQRKSLEQQELTSAVAQTVYHALRGGAAQ
jgi:hypothetical protein